jgi:glucosyl-dolichyl phosphate glucuronosyltransferase
LISNISIIICTRNRAESLRQTIGSIGKCDIPPGMRAELLVVDNGSLDDTREAVEQADLKNMPVRYLREPRAGKSYAYNLGIAEAQGEVLLFTDDDVRVPCEWVVRMATPLVTGGADAVVGGIRIAASLERSWMTQQHRSWLAAFDGFKEYDRLGWRRAMIGANMGFARHVTKSVPAFDPELGPGQIGFGEEILFSGQLVEAGYRIEFAKGAEVEHHFDPRRLSRKSFLAAAKAYGRSNAYLCHHWSHETRRWTRLHVYKMHALLAWFRLRHGKPAMEGIEELEMGMRSYLHFCEHYLIERRRPRNYARHGPVKLERGEGASDRDVGAAERRLSATT